MVSHSKSTSSRITFNTVLDTIQLDAKYCKLIVSIVFDIAWDAHKWMWNVIFVVVSNRSTYLTKTCCHRNYSFVAIFNVWLIAKFKLRAAITTNNYNDSTESHHQLNQKHEKYNVVKMNAVKKCSEEMQWRNIAFDSMWFKLMATISRNDQRQWRKWLHLDNSFLHHHQLYHLFNFFYFVVVKIHWFLQLRWQWHDIKLVWFLSSKTLRTK